MAIDIFLYKYDNDTHKTYLEGIVDDFDSISFERSYAGVGEFAMTISGYSKNIAAIKRSNILRLNSYCCGLITDVIDERDSTQFTYKVKGVELKGLASKRIVYPKITTTMAPEDLIKKLLEDNMLNVEGNRYIAGEVVFDDNIKKDAVAYDNRFDNVAEAIQTLCDNNNIGWYATLAQADEGSVKIVFHIYHGVNRSYEQSTNSRFIISYDNNNLSGAILEETSHNYNMSYVAGQGEDEERHIEIVNDDDAVGWDRTELYVDARDISEEDIVDEETQETTTPTEALQQRGTEKLAEYGSNITFEATPSAALRSQYHKGYELGDMGTVIKDGGHINAQITQITEVYEDSEWQLQFTFGYDSATLASTIKRLQSNATSMSYADPTSGGNDVYSTNEQAIGTWIDGKTIYRKVINRTSAISKSSSSATTIATGITGLGEVIRLDGMVKVSESGVAGWHSINSYHSTSLRTFARVGTSGNIICYCASTNTAARFIIEYTKA